MGQREAKPVNIHQDENLVMNGHVVRPMDLQKVPKDSAIVRMLGVDYIQVPTKDGGKLYVTKHGVPWVRQLLPENWEDEKRERLMGSSSVYKITTKGVGENPGGQPIDIVLKWNRVGEEVHLHVADDVDFLDPATTESPAFASPYQEFSYVMEFREGKHGPSSVMRTQRPLAIYLPSRKMKDWQTPRKKYIFDSSTKDARHAELEMDWLQPYGVIYGWVKGENLVEALDNLGVGDEEKKDRLRETTKSVVGDMKQRGFIVSDIKPHHIIVRRKGDELLQDHDGKLAYALVDFELLGYTGEYFREKRGMARADFLTRETHRFDPADIAEFPKGLSKTNVFGVDYVFGMAGAGGGLSTRPPEDTGGSLWVVGKDPFLVQYLSPEKWINSPSKRINQTTYNHQTPDGLFFMVRHSKVGQKMEPGEDSLDRMAEYGYNSPFEEVSMAERMRQAGINTVYPRAVYQSKQESRQESYMLDNSRYESHRGILDQWGNPILNPRHPYFTLWSLWRGRDHVHDFNIHGHSGNIAAVHAFAQGEISKKQLNSIVESSNKLIRGMGVQNLRLGPEHILLTYGEDEMLKKSDSGEFNVTFAMDALRLRNFGIITQDAYHKIMRGHDERMKAAGFEDINLHGTHLLLGVSPEGSVVVDEDKKPAVTHCNFEFVRQTG